MNYSQNLGNRAKLETGLKSTLRHDDRSQNFGQLNLSSNIYEEVVLGGMPINNSFTRDENVHAGYLIFRNNNGGRGFYSFLYLALPEFCGTERSPARQRD